MSNSASEPIDLDVTDASTASKRPQWTLPPRLAMPKTTDPEMIGWEFRDNLKTYVVEEKHASKRGNTSWIWGHGFQCHRRGPPFPHPLPATSCEAERAFSGCKYPISDHRSRLGEDILEALECDGARLRAGL